MAKREAFKRASEKIAQLSEPADVIDVEHQEPMMYEWQVLLVLRALEEDLKEGE